MLYKMYDEDNNVVLTMPVDLSTDILKGAKIINTAIVEENGTTKGALITIDINKSVQLLAITSGDGITITKASIEDKVKE